MKRRSVLKLPNDISINPIRGCLKDVSTHVTYMYFYSINLLRRDSYLALYCLREFSIKIYTLVKGDKFVILLLCS